VKTSKLVNLFSSNCGGFKSKWPIYSKDKLLKPAIFQIENSPSNTPLILVECYITLTYTLCVVWLDMLREVMLVV
jgi:hypothetical protein